MDDLILHAARLAKQYHAGQTRKYHQQPFVLHPARVAARVMLLEDVTPVEVAAAWLHDVVEDTDCSEATLLERGIPQEVVTIVRELTNPSQQHPQLPRAERKRIDREHLRTVSRAAKRIKLIDRIDNLRDLDGADREYQSLYVAESIALAGCLEGVDDPLTAELFAAIEELGFARDHQDRRAPA